MKKIIGISSIVSNNDVGKIKLIWEEFFKDNVQNAIKTRVSNEIYCIYTDYSGDYTKPYKLLIGYETPDETQIPENLDFVLITAINYEKTTVTGELPQAVINAWQNIWQNKKRRAYRLDYDKYLENGTVEINVEYLP